MRRLCVPLLTGALLLPAWCGAAVFEIPDGNYSELRQAIRDANATPEQDSILLAQNGTYRPGGALALDPITAPLRIYGQNATIDGAAADGGRLFEVADDGALVISDLNIVNVEYTVTQGFFSGGVVYNRGNTLLRNLTIAGTRLTVSSGSVIGAVIANTGSIRLSNVTLSDNFTDGEATAAAFHNSGNAVLENTTITDNEILSANGGPGAVLSAVFTNSSESMNAFNSIIAGNPDGDCDVPLSSGGGNLDGDGSCGFGESSDQSAVNPMLQPLADNGGGLLTHTLPSGSPAVDAGVNETCTAMDARGVPRPRFGSAGTGPRCDIGAHERRTGGASFNNAVTGSWFDPEQNGHGFMVEILPPGNLLLATWFVFDPNGNRDWLQAVGEIRDGIAKLTAFRIEDGLFPPQFDADDTRLRYWGTFSMVMNGCNSAAAAWAPDLFGYPEGGMPLARLTRVAGLNCP